MNTFVKECLVEHIERLALGLEPIDAARGGRLAHPVRVDVEGKAPWTPRKRNEPYAFNRGRQCWLPRPGSYPTPDSANLVPPLIDRHDSCLHVLLYSAALQDRQHIDIRIYDHDRRYVPRRFRVPLLTLEEVLKQEDEDSGGYLDYPKRLPLRVRRPFLFPGAAYDVAGIATGLRGRVVRDARAMRWVRVEARLPSTNALVGRAYGDDRGEFLLLLTSAAAPFTELRDPFDVRVKVFGPAVPPTPAPPGIERQDKFWDLPLEKLTDPGDPDPISRGETLPDGYVEAPLAGRVVPCRLGRVLSGLEKFVFATP